MRIIGRHFAGFGPMGVVCLVLASLVAGAGGCAQSGASKHIPISGAEIPIVGALAVDVQNIRGVVDVEADAGVKAAEVSVLSLDPSTTSAAAAVFVGSQLAAGEYGAVLRIASADTADGTAPRMLIRVRVPACDGLRIRTAEGNVRAVGTGGAVDIDAGLSSAGQGGVLFVTDRPLNQPVSIATADGPVSITIPSSSDLSITVEAPEGIVKLEGDRASMTAMTMAMRKFIGRMGAGTSPMIVRAGKGDAMVKIDRRPRP